MQGASHSLSDTDTASGGVYRLYGRWFNPKKEGDSGSLIFKIEHSHSYLDQIPPEELAGQIGYLGSTGTQFSDQKLVLNDFNWLQDFNGGNGAFVLGRYDVKDYMDVVDYADPWTTFQNNNILENHSIALPDTSYGVGASHWVGGQWVVLASVTDANGSLDDLAAFRYGAEFFSFVELGWSPSTDTYDLKSIHLTLWHVDERTHDDKPEGKGAALGGSWTFDRRWLVFARTGLSTGGASNMRHSSTFGFNYLSREYFDGFGLAINYAEPSDESLRDQSTMEMFFRMQISQNIAVTPSFQLLLNPALNPQQDHIEVYGLRFRIAL
jgi:porin